MTASKSRTARRQLSVAVIARNAEQALEETLASVRRIADEIVVADTGSSDGTRLVGRRHAARIVDQAWRDDFSAARNACWEHVTGDWVLWLDAGERLDADDASTLRQFVDLSADPAKAYWLAVRVPPADFHGDGTQIAQLRLVPNRSGLQFVGRVREQLLPAAVEAGLAPEGLPQRILRGPREHALQTRIRRARRNVRLAELDLQERGPRPEIWNSLGDAHLTLGDLERARHYHELALGISQAGTGEMLEAYYGKLAAIADHEPAEALFDTCLQALAAFPLDIQLLCVMGGHLQRQGRLELATRSFETAYRYGQVVPTTWHLVRAHELATVCYAIGLQLLGQHAAADEIVQTAAGDAADCRRMHRWMIDLHLREGRAYEAQTILMRSGIRASDEVLEHLVEGARLAIHRQWAAAESRLAAAYTAGCRDPLCMKWLSATWSSLGWRDRAQVLLHEWSNLAADAQEVAQWRQVLNQPVPQDGQRAPQTPDVIPIPQPHVAPTQSNPATRSRVS